MAHHCHGGVSADFAFHARDGLSNQSRITASPVRYGLPEIRYFSNGGDSMNRLHQIYAAGHGLALCHQHILDAERGARRPPQTPRRHSLQPRRGADPWPPDLSAEARPWAGTTWPWYRYRGRSASAIITVVNTSEDADYTGRLELRAEHAGSSWTDLISGRRFIANGAALQIAVPRGGRSKLDNLLVLQQTRP